MRTKIAVILGLLFILLASFSIPYFFYQKYREAEQLVRDYPIKPDIGKNAILERINRLTNIPPNESPQIVKILDAQRARDQPFFAGAKNGDIILIYSQAQKAILYDPVADKIIQEGPLVVRTPTPIKDTPGSYQY